MIETVDYFNMPSGDYSYQLSCHGVLSRRSSDLLLSLPINKNEGLNTGEFVGDEKRVIYIICTYSDFEIHVGATFNILYDRRNKLKFKINLRLVKVYLGYPDIPPLDVVPHGWKTICKFLASEEDYAIAKTNISEANDFCAYVNFELHKYEE